MEGAWPSISTVLLSLLLFTKHLYGEYYLYFTDEKNLGLEKVPVQDHTASDYQTGILAQSTRFSTIFPFKELPSQIHPEASSSISSLKVLISQAPLTGISLTSEVATSLKELSWETSCEREVK